jgi:hypothetical protein
MSNSTPRPAITALLLAIIATLAVSGIAVADPMDTLDQFCGGALSSPGCLQTVAAYPVETGALVAIIEVEKSKMASANDCQNKLSAGTAMFSEIAPYVSDVGADVSQIVKASCIIAFSTKTCSGEAQKIASAATDAVAWALHQLDSLLGLDDTPSGPTLEQNLAEYWATVYEPMERPMIGVPDAVYIDTASQLDKKCMEEWWVTNEDEFAVCRLGFTKRFHTEVDVLRAQYQAYLKGQQEVAQAKLQAEKDKLQAEKDKLQAAQDATIVNARMIALSWARIKHDTYVKQCHDQACIDDVTATAFFYYGALASGMQKMSTSNTQVLTSTNAAYEPIFKQQIAKDEARRVSRLSRSKEQISLLLAPRQARLQHVQSVRTATRAKLLALGVRNGDAVLRRAYRLRAHHVNVRGLAWKVNARPGIR